MLNKNFNDTGNDDQIKEFENSSREEMWL